MRRLSAMIAVLMLGSFVLLSRDAGALTISPNPPNANPIVSPVLPSKVNVSWDTDATTTSDQVQYGPAFTRNWTIQTVAGSTSTLVDVDAVNSQLVYAIASNGWLYSSSDGGSSWSQVAFISSTPTALAVDPATRHVWVSSGSVLYRYDGTQVVASCGAALTGAIRDFNFVNNTIWVVASGTTIYRYTYNPATGYCSPVLPSGFNTGVTGVDSSATSYTSITAYDTDHVFATSNDVAMSWTTNGGTTWSNFNVAAPGTGCLVAGMNATCAQFEDIGGASATKAFAVGRNGYLYSFVSGVWKTSKPTTLDFISLGVGNATKALAFGCCSGGKDYYAALNDGETWSLPVVLTSSTLAQAAMFVTPNVGWIVGSAGKAVLHSASYANSAFATSGGNPHQATLATGLQQSVNYHANAKSSTSGVIPQNAESGDFLFTTAGLTITGTGAKTANLRSTSTDIVWTTSLDADTVAHVSPAQTWKVQSNVATTTFQDIDAEGNRAFTVGAVGDVIVSTNDLGQTWSAPTATSNFATSVSMQGTHGWAVGNGFVLRTTNAGGGWNSQAAPSAYYLGVFGLDDLHAWAVGAVIGAVSTGTIIRTTDGGANWQTVLTPTPFVRDVWAADGNTVIVVGDSTKIYRSTDGGSTWSEATVTSPATSFLRLSMADANTGWAVGTGGVVVQTTDAGKTWNQVLAGCSNQTLYGVSAVSPNEVWIVGSSGTVKHWTPATGCQSVATGISASTDARAVDATGTDVWIAGSNGTIARYGLDTGSAGYRTFSDSTRVPSHTAPITTLTPITTYNYFVQSTDNNGFTVVSGLKSFQTLAQATMQLSPTSLGFSGQEGAANPGKQQFQVADQFGSNLGAWSMVSNQPWLTAAPAAGSSTSATPATVDVNVSTSGLTAGNYSGKITVTATDPSVINRVQDVNVTLTVTLPPKLVLATNSLSFTAQQGDPPPASQAVNVTNGNVGSTLNYTMSRIGGATWLNVSSTGVSPYPTPNQVVVQPNTTATVGAFTETIRVDGGVGTQSSPQDISVTYTVTPAPALKLTPGPNPTLSFSATQGGGNPLSQTVVIENDGAGTLSWIATVSQSWLSFSPANGGNGPTTVTVSPQTGSLSPGLKTGTITVNAGTAGDQTINVNFDIAAAPVLSVTPTSLTFTTPQGTNPSDKTFSVTGGGSTWSAAVTSGGTWLSLPGTTSGSTYPTNVPVRADVLTTNLLVGTYAANIRVTSSGAIPNTIDIPLTLDVTAPPVLAVSPITLNFSATQGGANPASQPITIANIGAGTLNWTMSQPAETWVRFSTFPCAGPYPATISGTAPSTVNACIDISTLNAGSYSTTVSVQAAGALGAPKPVTVNLTVNPDTTGPVMSSRQIQTQCDPTNVFAYVEWTTDEPSDSTVYYGETVDGSGAPQYELPAVQRDISPNLVTDHNVYIENLNGGHRYYVKISSADRFGNTTAADKDPNNSSLFWNFVASGSCDTAPPQNVTLAVPPNPLFGTVNVRIDAEDQSGVDTVELYSILTSGTPPFARIAVPPGACTPAGAIYQCSVIYSWNTTLVPDGTYDISARAIDINLNAADSATKSVTIDNAKPTVRNVRAEPYNVSGVWNAKITWDTNKESSSRVDYGLEDAQGDFDYNQFQDGDDNACNGSCTSHQVTLPNLIGGQIYHFQVTSCSVINPTLCGH